MNTINAVRKLVPFQEWQNRQVPMSQQVRAQSHSLHTEQVKDQLEISVHARLLFERSNKVAVAKLESPKSYTPSQIRNAGEHQNGGFEGTQGQHTGQIGNNIPPNEKPIPSVPGGALPGTPVTPTVPTAPSASEPVTVPTDIPRGHSWLYSGFNGRVNFTVNIFNFAQPTKFRLFLPKTTVNLGDLRLWLKDLNNDFPIGVIRTKTDFMGYLKGLELQEAGRQATGRVSGHSLLQ